MTGVGALLWAAIVEATLARILFARGREVWYWWLFLAGLCSVATVAWSWWFLSGVAVSLVVALVTEKVPA